MSDPNSKTKVHPSETTSYDTNSLRLITPRLCTYNVNVNRPYLRIPNVNRMFMVDMTYMPGYFIEEYPHKFYKNRAASWSPGSRPVALPPGLTKAGVEEKQQLRDYIKERQKYHNYNYNNTNTVGSLPIRIERSPSKPSLNLLSKEYKRPLTMYDVEATKHERNPNTPANKPYTIHPPLKPTKNKKSISPDTCTITVDKNSNPQNGRNYTAGKSWSMDKFRMWSGGTDGSVEFPKWSNPNQYSSHQNWAASAHEGGYRRKMSEYARRVSVQSSRIDRVGSSSSFGSVRSVSK